MQHTRARRATDGARSQTMLDLVFILATLAFFGVSLALTHWLDTLDRPGAP